MPVRTSFLNGVALWTPWLPGWEVAAPVLRGEADPPGQPAARPAPALLAPTERRRAPERIFLSVGDGNIISGLHKGLKDLLRLGWIEKLPKLVGVQSEGSAAVANAFQAGTEVITPVAAHTLADSIAADRPADGLRALRAATQTGGSSVTVPDEEILQAIVALGRDATLFAEPAAATAYAGLLRHVAAGAVDPDEHVVVLITGSGLKDVAAAARATPTPPRIDPSVGALRQALGLG